MKSLYKYPQDEYPYSLLVDENKRRGVHEPEFELLGTGMNSIAHILGSGQNFCLLSFFCSEMVLFLLHQITIIIIYYLFDYPGEVCFRMLAVSCTDVGLHLECLLVPQISRQPPLYYNVELHS